MSAGLLLHAARTARARQLAGRLRRPVARRRFPRGDAPPFAPPAIPLALWRSPAFETTALAGRGSERLRAFHAHYGEEVLEAARAGDADDALRLARGWIAASPPRPGDAWHPYTTSTRICSWIAAAALAPPLAEPDVARSLWRQLRHLELNVEDDILGNHVLRNARALVLGGVAFGSDRLLDRGRRLLERELPEQILPDGGHYERSPVYHEVVLRDLVEADAAAPGIVPAAVLERMRSFAAGLRRPDGSPALFNDGALDLAPRLELPAASEGLSLYADTGYAVLRDGPLWLAFDCGPPAPPFLPPHAHADALSFQLWWEGRPVVVDPGTSTYEPGAVRDRERGTRAHATVAFDGLDQFQLWGAFRSGPFPPVELLEATPARLRARVTWRHGVVHTRTIEAGRDGVAVTDELDGSGEHLVESALPLAAPEARVEAVGRLAAAEEPGVAAERLYDPRPCLRLVQQGRLRLPAVIGWRIFPDGER